MFVAEISIARTFKGSLLDPEPGTDGLHGLLAAWWHNGQIASIETILKMNESGLSTQVRIYEPDALDEQHGHPYVTRAWQRLESIYGCSPRIQILGRDPDGSDPCRCEKSRDLILYTHFLSRGSPVRCQTCFHPVPLYQLPPLDEHGYSGVLRWMSDYSEFRLKAEH